MKKLIAAAMSLATVAALAVPAVSMANVNVNDQGIGSIGKGDVQNALGYANDAAFQADASKITFSYDSDVTNTIADIKCSAANVLQPGDPFEVAHNVVDTLTTQHPANVKALTNGAGKVTGYTATGIGTGQQVDTPNWSNYSHCPSGEHFMGWLNGASQAFHTETIPGSSVLRVSNGTTTVPLPNTPVL